MRPERMGSVNATLLAIGVAVGVLIGFVILGIQRLIDEWDVAHAEDKVRREHPELFD
jgi:uncharacterized membrane protein YciS (DUF1049 family)